jgi:glycosyltransferase involved in cell wall biosynthesis
MWTYTRQLVPAMARLGTGNSYRLDVRRAWLEGNLPANVEVRRPLWPFPRQGSRRSWIERIDKFAWEEVAWPLEARHFDLMHSLYFSAPIVAPCPVIVTIHDTIPLTPGYSHSRAADVYSRIMRSASRRAAAIITVSNFSRNELAETFDYPAERIHVTPEAPDPNLAPVADESVLSLVRKRYGLPRRYILYLGGTEARKNIATLLQAWALGPPEDTELVIVGRFPSRDDLFPDMPALAERLGIRGSVHFVPFVESDDMAAVYSCTLAFCYPSRYEGFGLPPLEAMACGVPVIAADSTSLPEVVGGGAKLVPPDDVDGWHEVMVRTASDPDWRRDLIARGSDHVKQFSWEHTARLTLDVYDKVLSR